MTIRGNQSKRTYTVTPDEWERMQQTGASRKYTVISTAGSRVEAPAAAVVADYAATVAAGEVAHQEGNFEEAVKLYTAALAIKHTKRIKRLLDEVEGLLK